MDQSAWVEGWRYGLFLLTSRYIMCVYTYALHEVRGPRAEAGSLLHLCWSQVICIQVTQPSAFKH